MIIAYTFIFFILGLIIGSFLNVVIIRFNTKGSFWGSLGGRSGCMSCMHALSWYELIPLFSFLGLSGRCKNCKTKISIQYPIVEFLSGLIFASLFLKFQDVFFFVSSFKDILVFGIAYAYYAFMFSLLLVIAVYDFRHKIIPDSLSLVLDLFAFFGLFLFFNSIFYPHIPSILEFLSGLLIASPFAFFWLVSSGSWMGLGDAKLAVGLGWLVGLSQGLSGMVLAFWTGAIVGVALVIFSKKYGMKSEIPFAPYLVFGAFLAFIFGLRLFALS